MTWRLYEGCEPRLHSIHTTAGVHRLSRTPRRGGRRRRWACPGPGHHLQTVLVDVLRCSGRHALRWWWRWRRERLVTSSGRHLRATKAWPPRQIAFALQARLPRQRLSYRNRRGRLARQRWLALQRWLRWWWWTLPHLEHGRRFGEAGLDTRKRHRHQTCAACIGACFVCGLSLVA